MYSKNIQFFTGKKIISPAVNIKRPVKLLCFGIALLFLVTANYSFASESQTAEKYENIDSEWLPWLGSWRLVSNKVNAGESSAGGYFLTISPGDNKNSVTMKGHRDDKVLVEETIIADGLRHPLNDKKCTGYYKYSWSENGKRLLLNSESNCPGDPPRQISGMSIINEKREWLDIQLLQNGKEKAISIRKYMGIDSESTPLGRFDPNKVSLSRIAAGKNFTIKEIKELSNKVEPEVLEAALLELRKPFPINAKQLAGLADSGVDSRVIDLMVAFTFPEKFNVKQEPISMTRLEGNRTYFSNYYHLRMPYRHYSYYCPILPWHWASSSYMHYAYDYSYLGWYFADGYYYYPLWTRPDYYYTGGGGGGGGARGEEAAAVRGRGYTRTAPGSSGTSYRRAVPRNPPATQSAPVQSSSSSSSGGSSGSYSSGSRSSSSGSSSSTPTASPQGYSRGGR